MDTLVRDDLLHAVGQVMGFYNKKLEPAAARFWMNAFQGIDPDRIKSALMEYTKHGKYAPKPGDILDLVDVGRAQLAAMQPPPKEPVPCPEDIRKAWVWFVGRCTSGSVLLDGVFGGCPDVSPEQQERYLETVNQQAKQFDQPEAIPRECWLQHVWGHPCPHEVTL